MGALSSKRRCPSGSGECIAPRKCLKTKPCWGDEYQRQHNIIRGAAETAGRASLEKVDHGFAYALVVKDVDQLPADIQQRLVRHILRNMAPPYDQTFADEIVRWCTGKFGEAAKAERT